MTNQTGTSVDETTYNHPIDTEIVEDLCNEHTIYPDAPTLMTVAEAEQTLEEMQAHVHEYMWGMLDDYDILFENDELLIFEHSYWETFEDAKTTGLEEQGACYAIVHMHNQAAKEYTTIPINSHAYVIQKNEKVTEAIEERAAAKNQQ